MEHDNIENYNKKFNELPEKENKPTEQKITWWQKSKLKKIIKTTQKKLKNHQTKHDRKKLEQNILELKEIFDIHTDEGEEITNKNIIKLPTEELIQIHEDVLKELKKII